jgi:multisubunit Na+/H+ antiporter MnhE subunit
MTRPIPLVLSLSLVAIALALSVVIWPMASGSLKLAMFALGFAAGAAAVRALRGMV